MEILVALAIVALLAMMALPSMTSSIVRKQIVDAVPLVDFVKTAVAQSWATAATLPETNAAAGLPVPDKIVNNYVSSVTLENGAIQITFGNSAHASLSGKVLTLRPAVVADAPIVPVAWVCAQAAVPVGMTALGEDRTNIPIGMLPYNCRPAGK